jgi:propionyl-CoA carboxylase alpha subunit
MFQKILIANRGEIACRIIKTLKKLKIQSVAVYSEADKNALFVEMADESYEIGPAPAKDSYLNIDKICEIAKFSGAEAVHPGYGFLAENATFARALKKIDIKFIGPTAECLTSFGDKIEAKKLANSLNIPTLSGTLEPITGIDDAKKTAQHIGYPVLLKALAGGGGKGMRRVFNEAEIQESFERAQSEATSSFGDNRVFIEKYIEEPRHIEIQIIGDQHGNCIYLGERECSLQRRYQKIIEESPSPFIDNKLRKQMGECAVKLAKAIGYDSAGTVEFLLDKDKNFYFLEMNPRLQVEHPVTELVTGIDIVETMLHVAAGNKLLLAQNNVEITGHAIEARLCAEDPLREFMPSIGLISRLNFPTNLRVDSGIEEGDEITPYYDPMIAKIIAYGEDREEAIAHLNHALNDTVVKGIESNIVFLQTLLLQPDFIAGNYSTHFIEAHFPDGFSFESLTDEWCPYLIAHIHDLTESRFHPNRNKCYTIIHDDKNIRLNNSFDITGTYSPHLGLFNGTINDNPIIVKIIKHGNNYSLVHNGKTYDAIIDREHISYLRKHIPLQKEKGLSNYVLSPMPGLLLSLNVQVGEQVKTGQSLAIVEAMKMENIIRATREGCISKIHALPGDNVSTDQPLIEFEHAS